MAKKKPEARKQMSSFEWRSYLKKVSRDLLKDVAIREALPDDVISSGWMGYDGATESQIAALEKRLRRPLPPSYRSFLTESNGWRNCGCFIDKLWPCSKVAWFRKRNQEWIEAYVEPWEDSGKPDVSDEEYFVYGDKQNSCKIRVEYLQTALEVSDCGDSAIVLLNPKVITEDGEWEAWLFANWLPGATRYRSFRELMQAEHKTFLRLQKENPSKSQYGNAGQ